MTQDDLDLLKTAAFPNTKWARRCGGACCVEREPGDFGKLDGTAALASC